MPHNNNNPKCVQIHFQFVLCSMSSNTGQKFTYNQLRNDSLFIGLWVTVIFKVNVKWIQMAFAEGILLLNKNTSNNCRGQVNYFTLSDVILFLIYWGGTTQMSCLYFTGYILERNHTNVTFVLYRLLGRKHTNVMFVLYRCILGTNHTNVTFSTLQVIYGRGTTQLFSNKFSQKAENEIYILHLH